LRSLVVAVGLCDRMECAVHEGRTLELACDDAVLGGLTTSCTGLPRVWRHDAGTRRACDLTP